jgi:CRP-like cAMP-binding protein
MNEQVFPAGTVIFRPGDPGACAYLIREGTVELLRGADASTPVALLAAGEVFGEMSLIEERPHSLTARAKTAVKAHALARDQFERLLTTDPALFRAYLKALFERLRVLSARFETAAEPAPAAKTITVTMHPLTRRAAETLPEAGLVIPKFPFRIGRAAESREHDPLDLNELWLLDKEPFHVSRNHALVNIHDGAALVVDRGSKRGTHVNDVHIGVRTGRPQAILEDGDNVVILGGLSSPYQFRVHVARG